ncbi:MAG: FapA family protein [Negativicutes bacterium]|nr:FapA family protein [Negativicutes bacterium]
MNEDQIALNEQENATCTELFEIALADDGYYLTVHLPGPDGKSVKGPEVLDALRKRNIKDYNPAVVLRTIKEAAGVRVKIAPPPEPEVDPVFIVLVSRDRMEASLQIDVPKRNCRKFTIDEVYASISQAGVVFGIDHDAVEKAFERPGIRTVIARGQLPVDGVDAYIKYYVDLESKGRPAELEDGSVDFKNLNLFTTVTMGQLLAEKVPPTPGTPGTDVTGQPAFAKPGKDIPLPLGKNVAAIDQKLITASMSGQLVIVNNKLNVVPVIEVKEDVDLSTGNIDFVGSVIVRGSVQNGFTVKAEGDVEIMGTVSGGTVEGKNVVIRMGILGMNTGYVKAVENVSAKFIENALVYAGNDVIVTDVILHSQVSAGKRVIVEGRRGQITGGKVSAGEEIRAKTVGTYRAPNTDLEVGVNPLLREEYLSLRKEIKRIGFTYDQAVKGLQILRSMDQRTMPADKKEMLLKLTKMQFQLAGQLEAMKNRIMDIELAFEELKTGRIRVADIIYPGVKIVIGSLVKPIREVTRFVTFYAEDGEIKTAPFK